MAETTRKANALPPRDEVLARVVVDSGLATSEEVEAAREVVRKEGGNGQTFGLGDVLVASGFITQRQLDRLQPQLEERNELQVPGFAMMGKLGAGAMATVFKARQLSLDRIVAIKLLPKRHTNNPQFVERFYAEGKAAAKLNHPNIVQAIDVGKAGDLHYFVMEYVEGRTVFDDLTEHGRYSEKRAVEIAIQVAEALEHAHKAGFIHRDVKPKNIMITKDGVAKLADMGLARAVSDREAAEAEQGKAFGTPYYISPEQVRGERDVDFRADLYSLGATLYQMVTGKVPFEGPNPSAVMHKHLKEPLTPPDHLNPDLSNGFSEIIEVCMAKRREERYGSTADLLDDLKAVARGEPPLHARKKFDLSSLTNLEAATPPADAATQSRTTPATENADLMANPLFWIALVGWLFGLVMGGVLVLRSVL